jgi:hypothetical protein
MKMISRTSKTSISGVTLISAPWRDPGVMDIERLSLFLAASGYLLNRAR